MSCVGVISAGLVKPITAESGKEECTTKFNSVCTFFSHCCQKRNINACSNIYFPIKNSPFLKPEWLKTSFHLQVSSWWYCDLLSGWKCRYCSLDNRFVLAAIMGMACGFICFVQHPWMYPIWINALEHPVQMMTHMLAMIRVHLSWNIVYMFGMIWVHQLWNIVYGLCDDVNVLKACQVIVWISVW